MIGWEHGPVKKMKTMESNHIGLEGNGRFCFLPTDLLLLILDCLSLIDRLSFGAVCSYWRRALSRFLILSQDQQQEQSPWVAFLSVERECCHPALRTTGDIGDPLTGRVYSTGIPELRGALFLLSKYGWLLVFSSLKKSPSSGSSLFFFHPMSRSRIDLPYLALSRLKDPVFSISAPPTSQDCIVFVISCLQLRSAAGSGGVEIDICRHGENRWTIKDYPCGNSRHLLYALNVVYVEGIFYCLHRSCHLSAYNVVEDSWQLLWGPDRTLPPPYARNKLIVTSYVYKHKSGPIFCVECCEGDGKFRFKLTDPKAKSGFKQTDPTDVADALDIKRWHSHLKGTAIDRGLPLELTNKVILDSFDPYTWVGHLRRLRHEGKLYWHFDIGYPGTRERLGMYSQTNAIAWFEPRLIDPSSLNLKWIT